MRVRLLAFASATDALGASERDLELTGGARVSDLRRELAQRFPALQPLLPRLAIALDGEIASDETVLSQDAEVALLPPVSGG